MNTEQASIIKEATIGHKMNYFHMGSRKKKKKKKSVHWFGLTFSLLVVHGASLTTKPFDGPRVSSELAAAVPEGFMYAILDSFSTTSAN